MHVCEQVPCIIVDQEHQAGTQQASAGLLSSSGIAVRHLWCLQEGMQGQALDVEELARLGQRRGLCPYYAARAAQQHADLVLLPYSALLSQVLWLTPCLMCLALQLSLLGCQIVSVFVHSRRHSSRFLCRDMRTRRP